MHKRTTPKAKPAQIESIGSVMPGQLFQFIDQLKSFARAERVGQYFAKAVKAPYRRSPSARRSLLFALMKTMADPRSIHPAGRLRPARRAPAIRGFLGALNGRGRQAGDPCDMNTVGSVGSPRANFVQKDHITFPLPDRDGGVGQAIQLVGKRGQFVIMCGEKCPAPVHVVQMFERRPSNRQAVIGRCATTDFVQNNQCALARLNSGSRPFPPSRP